MIIYNLRLMMEDGLSVCSLVEKLSCGEHKVVLEERVLGIKQLEERIADGFVFIKFTETQGGTELGIDLLKDESDFSGGDFIDISGKLHVVGVCELNYTKVKCVAEIDLQTRQGLGHLEILGD